MLGLEGLEGLAGGGEIRVRSDDVGDAVAVELVADRDDDGILSADEAADAAARLVREADASGKGSLDSATLAHALRETIFPPHPGPPGPGPFPGSFAPERGRRRTRPTPPSDHPRLGRMDKVD